MRLSVVLPTYNRLDRLQRVIAGLEQQTYPLEAFEVVVVSDGSTDGTDRWLAGYGGPLRLRPLTQGNSGVSVARNHGLEYAQSPWILFLDDDVVPAPHLVEEHVTALRAEPDDKVAVLGPLTTPNDKRLQSWVAWEQEMLAKQYDDMIAGRWQPTARQFYTGNTSIAKHHLLEAGGFDPSYRRAEDVELAYRLVDRGIRFVFRPQAVGYHYAERSFASWRQIPLTYGLNDVQFTRDKGQEWLLPTIMYEFRHRHAMVRALTWACLDRGALREGAIVGLRAVGTLADALALNRLRRAAYSGIFNLLHYQGIASALGSRNAFFAQSRLAEDPVGPPIARVERSH